MSQSNPLIRVVRGRVLQDKEADFVERCRAQVADGGRAPGLLAFMAGYRRVEGRDQFVLVSTWSSAEDAARTAEEGGKPRAAAVLSGLAEIDSVDRYDLLQPTVEGILDAPGAVLRVTTATIVPGRRDDMFRWLAERRRKLGAEQFILLWAIGERSVGGKQQVVAVSAWASPLVIEAITDPGRAGKSLFAAADEFVSDTLVEQYNAIELRLPEQLADLGSRRLIAARFASIELAGSARRALSSRVESASETPISLAPLGSPGRAPDQEHLLVARVSVADYVPAERIIVDHAGEILLASTERAQIEEPDSPGERGGHSALRPEVGLL